MRFRFRFSWASLVVFIGCSSSSSSPGVTSPENDGGVDEDAGTVTLDDGAVVTQDGGKPVYVKTTNETMQSGGDARTYILQVPIDYDAAKKYPLYFWLHGNPGTAEGMLQTYPADPITKTEAIVVYPNATTSDGWDHSLTENKDVVFLEGLIDEIAGKYSIDKTRILLAGWSGGAFMASQMGCRHSNLFRAIGIHNGGAPYDPNNSDPNYTPPCDGAQIATIVTFGENDPFGGDYAAQYWAEHNGCGSGMSASMPRPCQEYDGCPAARPTKICKIPGGGHPLWDQAQAVTWAWFKALP